MLGQKYIKFLAVFSLVMTLLSPVTTTRAEDGVTEPVDQSSLESYFLEITNAETTDSTIELTLHLTGDSIDSSDGLEFRVSSGNEFTKTIPYEGTPQVVTIDGLTPSTDYFVDVEVYKNDQFITSYLGYYAHTSFKPYFEDIGLEYAVKNSLYMQMDQMLQESDLVNLKVLEASDYGISSLKGLEKATNLESITLYNNNVSDLTPLTNLTKLNKLYIGGNTFTDISVLSNLTQLTDLVIGPGLVKDGSVLANFPNLAILDVRETPIDLSVIESLKKLDYLNVSNVDLSQDELAIIYSLPNLEYLYIGDNQLTDISGIQSLTNLKVLDLLNNPITDFSALSNMTSLTDLLMENTGISNLTPLKTLTQLERLYLSDNNITDLSPLSGLDSLYEMLLTNNKISKMGALTELDSLAYVNIINNPLFDSAQSTIDALIEKDVYVDYSGDDIGKGGNEPKPVVSKPVVENGTATIENTDIAKVEKGDTLVIDLSQDETSKVNLTKDQIKTLKEKEAALEIKTSKVELQIPLTNLPNDKEISTEVKKIDAVEKAVSDVYDFTIYADGEAVHQFEEPVTLMFDVDETKVTNTADLKVFYFNEEKEKWELIPGAVYTDGKVSVKTSHFSIYTVFEVAATDNETPTEVPITDSNDLPETPDATNEDVIEENEEVVTQQPTTTPTEAVPDEEKPVSQQENGEASKTVDGAELPKTASNMLLNILLGFGIMLVGAFIFLKNAKKSKGGFSK